MPDKVQYTGDRNRGQQMIRKNDEISNRAQ